MSTLINLNREIFWNFSGHPEFNDDFVKVSVFKESLVSNAETITVEDIDFLYPGDHHIQETMRLHSNTKEAQYTDISRLFYKDEDGKYVSVKPVAMKKRIDNRNKVLFIYSLENRKN
ncbi:MAG: hypothetical protein QG674_131 [Patescibacteria group bacterium]|jgi:hypothetical protein|nr:hypothetical protein [Patescibacteria group bacterium]